MIKLRCEACHTPLTAPDHCAGKKGKCRKCGHLNLIPRPPGATGSGVSGDSAPGVSLFEATLAPDELIEGPALPVTPATVALTIRDIRSQRRSPWPFVAAAAVAVLLGSAYFVWPYVWEHFNASSIFELRTQARVFVSHGQVRSAVGKYDALLDLVGERQINNPLLRREVDNAKHEREAAVTYLTQTGRSANESVADDLPAFITVSGSVMASWHGDPPRPLAGITVNALRSKVGRSSLMNFYNALLAKARDDQSTEQSRAAALDHNQAVADAGFSTDATLQAFAQHDLGRANAYGRFISGLQQALQLIPAKEDLAVARSQMLESAHHYLEAAGQISPGISYAREVLGEDFVEPLKATSIASTTTDAAGHYLFRSLPAGQYYLYAFWRDPETGRAIEWLIPKDLGPAGDVTVNFDALNSAGQTR